MQAPDYTTLLDFERNLEAYFAAQFEPRAQDEPVIQQDDAVTTLPHVAVQVQTTGATDHDATLRYKGQVFTVNDMFNAAITVIIHSDRRKDGQARHAVKRSFILNLILRWKLLLNTDDLPYYDIARIIYRGMTPTVETEEDLDVSTMRFDLVFQVKPDAWPEQTDE